MSEKLDVLSFTVPGHISRPPAEVYEAVADPAQLSEYFTTGGAHGRLEVSHSGFMSGLSDRVHQLDTLFRHLLTRRIPWTEDAVRESRPA